MVTVLPAGYTNCRDFVFEMNSYRTVSCSPFELYLQELYVTEKFVKLWDQKCTIAIKSAYKL